MPATPASPTPSSSYSTDPNGSTWWQSVSAARKSIEILSTLLPSSPSIAALADSDQPAISLLHSPAAHAAISSALASSPTSGSSSDPLCHWLYDTLLSPEPDLRLIALSYLPLVSRMYLLRLLHSPSSSSSSSSLSGFEAVLLAAYSSEAKSRGGKPLLVSVPDLSLPSLYHSPSPNPSSGSKSPRSSNGTANNYASAAMQPVVGVLSYPLEPQVSVKSTKRAQIIGTALEAYYGKIAMMPGFSKVDLCDTAAAWAGQYCHCRFELDEEEGGANSEEIGLLLSSPSSSSPCSVTAPLLESGNGNSWKSGNGNSWNNGNVGRNCSGGEEVEEKVPVPWELLQPLIRAIGHCLLAPLNPKEVKDAASVAVRVVYARACHELIPQAILATQSLIQLDKSARKTARAASVALAGSPGSSTKPNTPSKQKKPEVLLVSK